MRCVGVFVLPGGWWLLSGWVVSLVGGCGGVGQKGLESVGNKASWWWSIVNSF